MLRLSRAVERPHDLFHRPGMRYWKPSTGLAKLLRDRSKSGGAVRLGCAPPKAAAERWYRKTDTPSVT